VGIVASHIMIIGIEYSLCVRSAAGYELNQNTRYNRDTINDKREVLHEAYSGYSFRCSVFYDGFG